MFSRSILSNYLGSIVGLAISKGLRFFAIALCIRLVGDYSWGQVVSTLAAFTFVGLLIDQGLGASSLLYRLQDRTADARLLFLVSLYRTALAILFVAGLHVFHHAIHSVSPLVLLYSFVMIPRALGIDWWFHRRELFQFTLYIASVRTFVFLLLALMIVKPGASAATVILAEMGAEAAAIGFAWILKAARRERFSPAMATQFRFGELLYFSLPFLAVGILNAVQSSGDVLLLGLFLDPKTVAEYDVGSKIGLLYFFFGASVIQIIRPKLTRLHHAGEIEKVGSVLRSSSSLLLLISSVFLVPALYFPEPILKLFFDFDRDLSTFTFRWVALWVGSSFMTMLCADTLLSLGRRRDYVRGAALCAAVNFVANLVLIPLTGGYGAIFAKILAEIAFMTVSLRRIPAPVRQRMQRPVMLQAGTLAAFVGVYLLSSLAGGLVVGFWVSIGLLALVTLRGGLFQRETLAVFRDN